MNDMMLIVDDVEMNREILKVIFHGKYDILEAESGEEALAMVEGCQGSIDIVLLDLQMGGITGFEVLEKRMEIEFFHKIPVVVITGSNNMEDQVKAFDLGANEYIAKPFVPEIVLTRVNNVMASSRRMHTIELEAEKLKIKSEIDEMTGLLNKANTEFHIDKILKSSEGKNEVLLIIDIDNFKTVNDTAGHQAGDHVLKIVSNLISGEFRKSDIVGRIGGDEFCALMVDVPNLEIARSKVNELIQIMRYKPNLAIPQYVTLSIGMAASDKKNISYANLFERADKALYEAKHAGKAQYREYGVEPVKVEEDKRPIAILLSNSRSVCSAVQALIPTYVRIVEALNLEDLQSLDKNVKERTCLLYADVSDLDDDQTDFWNQLAQLEWIDISNIFAICEEGNVPQYMEALKSGIVDMLTTPIDHDAFKRRTIRQLEKLGVITKEP